MKCRAFPTKDVSFVIFCASEIEFLRQFQAFQYQISFCLLCSSGVPQKYPCLHIYQKPSPAHFKANSRVHICYEIQISFRKVIVFQCSERITLYYCLEKCILCDVKLQCFVNIGMLTNCVCVCVCVTLRALLNCLYFKKLGL